MPGFWQQQFSRWLDRRIPRQRQLTLNQRRIFIFPTRQGFYFIIVLLLLLLAAINYQNNLIYVLVFFLASIANTAILFTYLNMSGLQLRAGKASSVFAGDYAEFEVFISRSGKRHYHRIRLGWPDNPAQLTDLLANDQQRLQLHYQTQKRGPLRPGRLLLESHYPLGLLRCWSWVDLDFQSLVWPRPQSLAELPVSRSHGNDGREKPLAGMEDFFGFRPYQQGDPLRHVNWRSVARGLPLQSKIYAAREQQKSWVDWDELPGVGTEERLSLLCDWALQLERRDIAWGLRLPGVEMAPDHGERHREQALNAMALYGFDGNAHD